MLDPVVASDGYSYERSAIERVLRSTRISPLTREQYDKCVELFAVMDRDHGGTLDAKELAAVLRTASTETYQIMCDMVNMDEFDEVDFLEFMGGVSEDHGEDMVNLVLKELGSTSRAALSEAEEKEVIALYQVAPRLPCLP